MRIETLRGFACVLLVVYHVIGADPKFGLRVEDGPVRWFNDGLAYLRMPLFTFLSGFVYGMRPFAGNSRAFLLGKAKRLLIPMLVVGSLYVLLQMITPGTNTPVEYWNLQHLRPVGHFWFLEAIFWVFLVVWALERWNLIGNAPGYALAFALACALYLAGPGWPWLGINSAIYLLPYFLLGLACRRFSIDLHLDNPWVRAGLVLVAILAVLYMGKPVSIPDRRTVPMLLAGVSLCLLCLGHVVVVGWLVRIGHHSYPIYLFHVFFTAAARIGVHRLGSDSVPLDIVLGLSFGLAGPILIDRIASRYRWSALLLLGKSRKPGAPGPALADRGSLVR